MKHILRNPSVILCLALQASLLFGILLAARVNSDSILKGNTVIREHTEEILNLIVNNTHNHTKVLLEPAENSVLLSHSLLQDNQINPVDNIALESYFLKQLQTHKQFSGMYFGRPDGSFIFVNRQAGNSQQATENLNESQSKEVQAGFRTKIIEFNPERTVEYIYRNAIGELQNTELDTGDQYDPRKRSWYQKANTKLQSNQKQQSAIWTDPYIFFDSRKPGITTAKTVINQSGINMGTIGIDIELSDLSTYLETITQNEHSSLPFIKTVDDIVIAFPDFKTYLNTATLESLPKMQEIGNEISTSFLESSKALESTTIVDFKANQESYVGTLQPISVLDGQPWLLGIYGPKEVYTGNIQKRYQQSLWRILGIGFLFSCLAIPISLVAVRPLNRLQKRASTDNLTGLLNRHEFSRQAKELKSKAENSDLHIAYLMLDLDNFKPINDIYGHKEGDEVLIAIAKRLSDTIKATDLIGRYGGDEFVMCLFDVSQDRLYEIVERIRSVITNQKVVTSKGTHTIGATLGAVLSKKTLEQDVLISLADNALIQGKTIAKGKSYISDLKLENLHSELLVPTNQREALKTSKAL